MIYSYKICFSPFLILKGEKKESIHLSSSLLIFSEETALEKVYNYISPDDSRIINISNVSLILENCITLGLSFNNNQENQESIRFVLKNYINSIQIIRFLTNFEGIRNIIESIPNFDRFEYEQNCMDFRLKNFFHQFINYDSDDKYIFNIEDLRKKFDVDYLIRHSDMNKEELTAEAIVINDCKNLDVLDNVMRPIISNFSNKRKNFMRGLFDPIKRGKSKNLYCVLKKPFKIKK